MASTYELIVKAVDQTSGPMNRIEKSLRTLSTEANKANQALEKSAGGKTASGFSNLGSTIGSIPTALAAVAGAAATAGLAFGKVLDATREFERIQNSLRLITNGTQDLANRTGELRALAEQNRTSFAATADLYTKLSISTKELGYNNQQVAQLTTKLSQALQVAGADAGTASGVIRQFGQAMASGTVRGDEFNSIVEGLGPALAIMARESGLTVGELRKMSQAGQLTADKFAQLLLNSNQLTESFEKMKPTISVLEQRLSDVFDRFLVNVGKATGATNYFARALNGMTQGLEAINRVMEKDDNSMSSLSDRMRASKARVDDLTRALKENGVAADGLWKPRWVLEMQLKSEQEALKGLTEKYQVLADVENENQRLLNRGNSAHVERINQLNAERDAALKVWSGYEKLATQSLGTDSVYELADAIGKAKLDVERLTAAQSALTTALNEGARIDNSTALLKGLGEAQLVAEGRLRALTEARDKANAADAKRAAEQKKRQEEEAYRMRLASDIMFRLTDTYTKKADALKKAESALATYTASLGTSGAKTDQQRFIVHGLTEEIKALKEALAQTVTGNAGELIATTAIDNVTKAQEKLKSVNSALEKWQKTNRGFQTLEVARQSEIAVVALEAEKKALEELIRVSTGGAEVAKPFSELYKELEKNVEKTTQAASINKVLFDTFNDGKRSIEELKTARELLNIAEKESTDIGVQAVAELVKKNAALVSIESALKRVKELTAGTTVTEAQLTEELLRQKKAMEKTTELSYYDKLMESIDKATKLTKDQEAAHSALNWKYLEGAINIDTYKAALKLMAAEGFEPAQKHLDNMITMSEMLDTAFKKSTEGLASNLAKSLASGKASLSSFKDYFNQILEDIAAAIIQKNITQPLVDGISSLVSAGIKGSGGGGGLVDSVIGFFTGRANGGIASGNKPTLVGERGPELFVPNTTGQIVSNEQLNSGGGGQTVVNFNINAVDTQTGVEFLLKNKPSIIGMITQAQNQRGRQGITS